MKINELLHPEVKKIFYNWLEKQGARENYKTTIQRMGNANDGYSLCQIINWSFIWERTPLGHSYWRDLNWEWRKYIIHYLYTHSKFNKWVRENHISTY